MFLNFKLEISGIFEIGNFRNFLNCKINKLSEFFEFGKLSEFQKFAA